VDQKSARCALGGGTNPQRNDAAGEGVKIVGIGGSTRPRWSMETVVAATRRRGAETQLITGGDLPLPPYKPGVAVRPRAAADRSVVKNALDYLEELRDDERPYLTGRPVRLAVTAYGWQAAVNTPELPINVAEGRSPTRTARSASPASPTGSRRWRSS
jgi:FMN reductase